MMTAGLQKVVAGSRSGLAAIEVVLTMAVMMPLAAVIFMMMAQLARWFYFLIVHTVGSPVF